MIIEKIVFPLLVHFSMLDVYIYVFVLSIFVIAHSVFVSSSCFDIKDVEPELQWHSGLKQHRRYTLALLMASLYVELSVKYLTQNKTLDKCQILCKVKRSMELLNHLFCNIPLLDKAHTSLNNHQWSMENPI